VTAPSTRLKSGQRIVTHMSASDITIRRATEADLDDVIAVGAAALGWNPDDPNAELFRWKHIDNPFGASPIWLAQIDGQIAGYRAFMRWELVDASGRLWRAVRAVDTATHPDFQRRGIFSRLTMHAVDEMAEDGVDIVFNTPNTQSRPGYLKMGWIDVGRLPVALRPTSPLAMMRLLRARTAAEKWSEVSTTGLPAADVLGDPTLGALVDSQPGSSGLATALSTQVLRWRYSLEPLRYRAWAPSGLADGTVFFRVRLRGTARECSVGLVLAPDGSGAQSRSLVQDLSKAVDADYVLRVGSPDARSGFFPLPGQGPRLTARRINSDPPPDVSAWQFQLGDIELF
jgi:GNAT superfamily N-acetyltransferase